MRITNSKSSMFGSGKIQKYKGLRRHSTALPKLSNTHPNDFTIPIYCCDVSCVLCLSSNIIDLGKSLASYLSCLAPQTDSLLPWHAPPTDSPLGQTAHKEGCQLDLVFTPSLNLSLPSKCEIRVCSQIMIWLYVIYVTHNIVKSWCFIFKSVMKSVDMKQYELWDVQVRGSSVARFAEDSLMYIRPIRLI